MGMPSRNVATAINEKIRLLRDFGVVEDANEDDIRGVLEKSVCESRTADYWRVLDRISLKLIDGRLGRGW